MARPTTPTVQLDASLQPAARVHDTFVRVATPEPSPLHDVARALSGLSRDLASFGQANKEKTEQEEFLRGQAAAWTQNAEGDAEGVRRGLIHPDNSRAFQRGRDTVVGTTQGLEVDTKVEADFNNWPGKNTATPEETVQFLRDRIKTHIGPTPTPWVMKGLAPQLNSTINRLVDKQRAYRSGEAIKEQVTAHSSLVVTTIRNTSVDGILAGELDVPGLTKNLTTIRDNAFSSGLSPSDTDKLMVDSIGTAALETRDVGLLKLYETVKTKAGIPLVNTPYGQEQRLKVEQALSSLRRQEDSEAHTRDTRARKKAHDDAVAKVYQSLYDNPNAEIPEELIRTAEKYDPKFRSSFMEFRKKTRDPQLQEDADKIRALHLDILSGGGDAIEKVKEAAEGGTIVSTETLKKSMDFAKQATAANFADHPYFNSSSWKLLEKEIHLRGKDPKFSSTNNLIDPLYALTPAGREALLDAKLKVLEFAKGNPNADAMTRERFMAGLHQQISTNLQRSDENAITYQPIPDASTSQNPAAGGANRPTREPEGPPQPTEGPAAATLPPRIERFIEIEAKRTGTHPDIIRQGVRERWIQREQQQQQAPQGETPQGGRQGAIQLPGGATLDFASATPETVQAVMQAVARIPQVQEVARNVGAALGYAPSSTSSPVGEATSVQQQTRGIFPVTATDPNSAPSGSPYRVAQELLGKHEVRDRQYLTAFLKKAGGKTLDPARTAWCARFINALLASSGQEGTGSDLARSFLKMGQETENPTKGDIVVLSRGKSSWQGHVGLMVKREAGRVWVLGGNQGNAVSIKSFPESKVLGYRRITQQHAMGAIPGEGGDVNVA